MCWKNGRRNMSESAGEILERLRAAMEAYACGSEGLCIAFSGGVDSSLVLKLACEAAMRCGKKVYAVTFDTVLHPACDREAAARVAAELGALHVVIPVNELQLKELRFNPPDRCYRCKRYLFEQLVHFAGEKGISCILDGTNADDLLEYRPGLKAIKELGIVSPLALAGIGKETVRTLAEELGISVASRPSAPCMATRLPYGAVLERETLRRIEDGEAFLRSVFSGNVRLRLHGAVARLEVDGCEMEKALAQRETLCQRLKELGFLYVTLDLEGFRTGSMDASLPENDGKK